MPADFRPLFDAQAPQRVQANFSAVASPVPPSRSAAGAASSASCGQVKVELKRDGDRVTEIRIHCRCGELIELACDY